MSKAADTKESKTVEPTSASFGVDTQVDSVAQYLDEYPPEQALAMMRKHIELSAELRKMGAGRWEVPPRYRQMTEHGSDGRPRYRFVRLGCMADVRRRDAILRSRFVLEQMGWKLAPSGTRNTLYLGDGDQGVYMCLPEIAGKEHDAQERKSRAEIRSRRFSRGLNRLPDDLKEIGAGNMRVESVDIRQGSVSADEFRKMR